MSKPFLEFDIADFSNTNTSNQTLAEIRRDAFTSGFIQGKAEGYEEAYKQGREDALNQLLEGLSHFNDTKNGNEHFLNGIETCREMIEAMKGENG